MVYEITKSKTQPGTSYNFGDKFLCFWADLLDKINRKTFVWIKNVHLAVW